MEKNNYEWYMAKSRIWNAQGQRCAICNMVLDFADAELHHISNSNYYEMSPEYDYERQVLCRECHEAETLRRAKEQKLVMGKPYVFYIVDVEGYNRGDCKSNGFYESDCLRLTFSRENNVDVPEASCFISLYSSAVCNTFSYPLKKLAEAIELDLKALSRTHYPVEIAKVIKQNARPVCAFIGKINTSNQGKIYPVIDNSSFCKVEQVITDDTILSQDWDNPPF